MTSYLDTPFQIKSFRYITLHKGLGLELKGMRMNKGRTAYSIIKQELGFKGNKLSVYKQMCVWLYNKDMVSDDYCKCPK